MRRREFITLLGGAAAAWPVAARAQRNRGTPSIGWIATGDPVSYRDSLAAFLAGLRTLNYIEGQNINIEYRWAEGNVARLKELANDLAVRNVDVILAGGSSGALAAKEATSVIPIVAAGVADLVELGLVKSLANPGGNLTGFVAAAPENTAKRVQIFKEIMPQARRAAVLWNPGNSNSVIEWQVINASANTLEITITPHGAQSHAELESALAAIPQNDPDFVLVLNDPFMFTFRKDVVDALVKARLPTISGFREYVSDGGLMSYGPNISDTYRRAATYVDKILRGAKPSDLPVDLPTKFELIVNLKTAKAIGLTIPEIFLVRADEVIE